MSFTVIANTETMPYLNWADQRRQNAASPGRLGRLCAADPGRHPPASRSYQRKNSDVKQYFGKYIITTGSGKNTVYRKR